MIDVPSVQLQGDSGMEESEQQMLSNPIPAL